MELPQNLTATHSYVIILLEDGGKDFNAKNRSRRQNLLEITPN